jgi:Flp pilus assembly pilin Flp
VKSTLQIARVALSDEGGAVLVEYTLLLLLIAMAALIGMRTYGSIVAQKMGNSNGSVSNALN